MQKLKRRKARLVQKAQLVAEGVFRLRFGISGPSASAVASYIMEVTVTSRQEPSHSDSLPQLRVEHRHL